MPEPVTIKTEESPALSADNIAFLEADQQEDTGEEGNLLAGKYKSVDELEKAYKELQSQFSKNRNEQNVEEPSDTEEAEPEGEAQPDGRGAKEIYGDLIGSRLEEAEIDFSDMNSRWQESGELAKEDYAQLNEAGFSAEMVDAYLAGLNYKAAADSQMNMQQVNDVKAVVGGEKEYNAMVEWAGVNLSKEEVAAYDNIVNTQPLATIKLAVAGIYARYTGSAGREPRLYGGRKPSTDGDVYESTAQVVEAMGDPKYKSDPAFRKKVQAKLGRSNVF